MKRLELNVLPGAYAVCRFAPEDEVDWQPVYRASPLVSITRTGKELSLVCLELATPPGGKIESGWRVLEVAGPLGFTLTGILAGLLNPLRDAGVSVFSLSTYDTDYLLIKKENLDKAVEVLSRDHLVNI